MKRLIFLSLALAAAGLLTAAAALPAADPPCFDNANRYVDCGNGTVTDTVTGLIWLQDANCYGPQNYATANRSAAALASGTCGLTDGSQPGDWRLPTKAEWETTVERAKALGCKYGWAGDPPSLTNDPGTACLSVGPSAFSGVQTTFGVGAEDEVVVPFYWSSTSIVVFSKNHWFVSLYNGDVGYSDLADTHFVWPVRGGQ